MTVFQKNKSFLSLFFCLAVGSFYLLTSCSEESMNRLQQKPTAFGKANQVVVIADEDVWEGEVGDTFRYYFASAFLILPNPESVFDLKHFTPEEIKSDLIRQELRTYILLGDITDSNSPTAKIMKENIGPERIRTVQEGKGYGNLQKKDKWAKGQLVLFMFGTNQEGVLDNIRTSYPSITKKIQDWDKKIIEAAVYGSGENRTLSGQVEEKIGLRLRIPNEYFIALDNPNLLWLRRETREMSSNLLLHKLPYEDPSQLSYEGFKSLRDSIGKNYISSTVEGSYMQINDKALPMFVTPTEMNELYTLEARGIWELTKDYMGGPFISYLVHNPNTNELYLLDGFVFAPGKDKRELIQYLEYIIGTTTFI